MDKRRLYDMRAYPHFTRRKTVDLNRLWDFKLIEDDVPLEKVSLADIIYNDRIPVPSAFDALFAYAGKRGIGAYRTYVDVTPQTRAALKIGGAGMSCLVYVDGERVGTHIGTYTPYEITLPPSHIAHREIVVLTDNRYDFERCPLHENYFDFYNYGGIVRQTWLEELPSQAVGGVYVLVDDVSQGKITVNVEFYDKAVPLQYRIDAGELKNAEPLDETNSDISFSAFVPNPTSWSPEAPNLHILKVHTKNDTIVVRFGLRKVIAANGEILLNDKPVKLLGYCRHEAHPQFGPATPDVLMVSDLEILKDLGCNFIRGVHYQQDPRLLDLCDEMGFLFFSESLGWGQEGPKLSAPAFIEAQKKQTVAMVKSDFNHPSIIMWGFLNEGGSHQPNARACYAGLVETVKSLDPSRLVTYASNKGLKDLFLEQCDVICFNMYPGWYTEDSENPRPLDEVALAIRGNISRLKERGLGEIPFVISEIGAGALYGLKDPHHGYWSEQYQADLLQKVCEEVVTNKDVAGLALWQFCDTRTYQGARALKRPRAFNNKGTLDEYRRPKVAYQTVQAIFRRANEAIE